jgi:hypothetical protein
MNNRENKENRENTLLKAEETAKSDMIYDEFVAKLTVSNIKLFNQECKKKHLDIKNSKKGPSSEGSRMIKETFMNIMNNVFGREYKKEQGNSTNVIQNPTPSQQVKREDTKDRVLLMIADKLFNRFKIVNCEIKSERYKGQFNHDYYYVNDISADQPEIDTYEFTCALCMFPKIDFKEKMKLLFDITDVDEDGYINEEEIRSMIFVVNFLFCDEEAPLRSQSSIINQSLASIKSQQMFNMIMKYPGELYKVVRVEKYVDFDQFYEAISKIDNFKYSIIPSFINFKNALITKKTEPEYEIEKKNLNDFLSITNEIVSNVKLINNEIMKGGKDIKKLIDLKPESKAEKLIKKKRNYIDENIKNCKQNTNKSNDIIIENDHYLQLETNSNTSNLPLINSKPGKDKFKNDNKKQYSNSNLKDFRLSSLPSEIYNLNYSKIISLEAHPGKIKVKENLAPLSLRENIGKIEEVKEKDRENYNSKLLPTHSKNNHMSILRDNSEKKKIFISYSDILQEIKILSNKKNFANNEDTEEIKRLIKNANFTGTDLIGKLKDNGSHSSLRFGKFTRNQQKGII